MWHRPLYLLYTLHPVNVWWEQIDKNVHGQLCYRKYIVFWMVVWPEIRKSYFWLSKILQENGKIVFKWVKALYLLQNRRWSQQTEAVTAYYPAVSLSSPFPPQILPPAAAIETRATPHCRLSGCCSNRSYLFAKYFYHRCSYNVADNKVWCLHRIFLRTSCYIQ